MRDKYTILKDTFGYTQFRPGQEEVIDALLAGRDTLAVMPTGSGKSLCYQIPALMRDSLTVVVSPLISLMKDQVGSLAEAGLKAAYLNSSLDYGEYGRVARAAAAGEYALLYIAPERLLKDDLRSLAEKRGVGMVVIDEAHCVSQWGHDFRPSYLQIAAFIASLPQRPVTAAFTATATAKVKDDIMAALRLCEPFSITTGFDRPNLYFEIQRPQNKMRALLQYLSRRADKSGIVYCATRKAVEAVYAELCGQGYEATRYHAGLGDRERRENQDDFLYDRKTIMVATNAFGMGIDKSNVSFVIHYNMPKNIESYYQEAGRAGRDGEPADCVLLYNGQDVHTCEYLIKNAEADRGESAEDHAALIVHKLELLKQMTFYATTTDCLRARIRAYFGEAAPHYCGACSNCLTQFEQMDITIPAQKIISCVLRLKQRGRRFGKAMIVNILRGSKSEKVLEAGLDTLSTYGIMADTDARRIREIMDFLIGNAYLSSVDGEYPVVEEGPLAGKVVFEKQPLAMMLSKEKEPAAVPARGAGYGAERGVSEAAGAFAFDELLFMKLKELRRDLARRAQLPAYIIFSDATLHSMCLKRPETVQALLEVPGVGQVKAERYGQAFLALIRQQQSPALVQ
jgi:ATP-dependent DNA helicase RecQ